MLFTTDRDAMRERFRSAWRRQRAGEPLEPLERQIATLVAEHPEYHALLESEDRSPLGHDLHDGDANPFLHLALHLALREQVGTDRPAGIAALTRALLLRHGDGHAVEHRMIECLGECLWEAQRNGRAPDEALYLERLRRLL